MAKKGQAIQLQAEINNDEDWEKLLQKDGLIIVDVYSEWCGPCSGMTATLKKLKLEIGGDVLQLAVAKADKITALERFRNKSEPTWMFISNGKMVNFMFGANAPKLTRLITEELKKEIESREGRRERIQTDISELADEERERRSVVENREREAREKEEAKIAKELYDRRFAECQHILDNLSHFGVILIFPHAKTKYQEAFGDLLGEAGLTINQTEKNIEITEQMLSELFYFGENPFPEEAMEEILTNVNVALLIKPKAGVDLESPIDEILRRIIYGAMLEPPGSPDSPAKFLAKVLVATDEEGNETFEDKIGIWTPESKLIKGTALKIFFHKLTEMYLIPEPEPTPPHYAVVFDVYQKQDVLALMDKYPEQILRYGFFNSQVPEEAVVVAKSIKKYERCPERNPMDKIVIQLSKKKSECVLAFVNLKPAFMSANAREGARECKLFFPDEYDEPPEEEEEEEEPEQEEENTGKSQKKKAESSEPQTDANDENQEEAGETVTDAIGEMAEHEDVVLTDNEGNVIEKENVPEGVDLVVDEPVVLAFLSQQVHLSDAILDEILFFSEDSPEELKVEDIFSKPSMGLLLKHNLSNAIDDVVNQMVYGNLRKPPGDEKSPYQKLLIHKGDAEMPGIWTPPNQQCKAFALKWIFPTVSAPYRFPDEQLLPPHLVMGFDAFKYKDVIDLQKQYPDSIINFGFFDNDIPGQAQLLSKTIDGFESRTAPPTYEEKFVVQVAKSDQWINQFHHLNPSYVSADAVFGAEEAKEFFPSSYNIPEETVQETKKKPKKKVKGKIVTAVEIQEEKEVNTDDQLVEDVQNEETALELEEEEEDLDAAIEEVEQEEAGGADKATSPIVNEEIS